jgi:hypothetical protein
VKNGTFGFGVFQCNDLNATYEELKAKGLALDIEAIKQCNGDINCVIALLKTFYNQSFITFFYNT